MDKTNFTLYEFNKACYNNELDIVKKIVEGRKLKIEFEYEIHYLNTKDSKTDLLDFTMSRGHLDIVQYLYEYGFEYSCLGLYLAKKNGHIDIINFFKYNDYITIKLN